VSARARLDQTLALLTRRLFGQILRPTDDGELVEDR